MDQEEARPQPDGEEENEGSAAPQPQQQPPYWLYRMGGGGGGLMRHWCEVCGHSFIEYDTYLGHFGRLPEHDRRMQELGIPNDRRFRGVGKLEDVRALWQRIVEGQDDGDDGGGGDDDDEEEDERQEALFRRADYEDLRRQGLI